MRLLILVLMLFSVKSYSQKGGVVWVDMVKVKDNHHKEVLYFLENNWKVYRDSAVKKGYIRSYKFLKNISDSIMNVDYILITEYHDQESFLKREEFFQPIMKAARPNGPISLNALKRDEILSFPFSYKTEVLYGEK